MRLEPVSALALFVSLFIPQGLLAQAPKPDSVRTNNVRKTCSAVGRAGGSSSDDAAGGCGP